MEPLVVFAAFATPAPPAPAARDFAAFATPAPARTKRVLRGPHWYDLHPDGSLTWCHECNGPPPVGVAVRIGPPVPVTTAVPGVTAPARPFLPLQGSSATPAPSGTRDTTPAITARTLVPGAVVRSSSYPVPAPAQGRTGIVVPWTVRSGGTDACARP